MKLILKVFFVIVCFLVCGVSQSLPVLQLSRALTIDDGLTQSSVSSLVQDNTGYLWIGTNQGLCRWSGREMISYTEDNGLIKNNIRTLMVSSDSKVYIGTFAGVSVFSGNKLFNISDPKKKLKDKIYSIYQKKDGSIIFATDNNGLIIKDNNRYSYFDKTNGLNSNSVVAIIETDKKELLIGHKTNGINVLRNDKIVSQIPGHEYFSRVYSFLRDTDGSVLITTNNGIFRYLNNKILPVVQRKIRFVRGKNSFLASDGTSYFVSSNSVYQLINNKLVEVITQKEANVGFNCIHITENGTFFIGTTGEGVRIYKKPFVLSLNSQNGFAREDVFGITQDKTGKILFATLGSGVAAYDGKKTIALIPNDITSNYYSAFTTSSGQTFFGSSGNGLFIYDHNRLFTSPVFDSIKNQRVSAIYEALDSSLYFCTSVSLWVLKKGRFENFGKKIGLNNIKIEAICNAKDGSLFLGVQSRGLLRIKNGEIKIFGRQEGLTDYDFTDIIEGKNASIYIATDGGLFILKNNKISSITNKNGLSDNTIYCIIEDDMGKLYAGTTKGLNVIDFSLSKPSIRLLGKEDGFASNEFNEKAAYKDKNGYLWFGTVKGASCYFPVLDQHQSNKPYLNIKSVQTFNESINILSNESKNIENQVEVKLEAVDVDSPEKTRFIYQLSGSNDDWITTMSNSLRFSDLSGGDYQLKIYAINGWNIKSSLVIVNFSIPVPFWRSWWMILIYSTVILSIIYYLTIQKRNNREEKTDIFIKLENLSKRENEIISYLLNGESYKSISEKTFISPATVQTHIKNIYKKLNIHSKYELFNLMKQKEKSPENL